MRPDSFSHTPIYSHMYNKTVGIFTSSVSQPPTMLRPSPVLPLEISMVVSQPGIMGQVTGSEARVAGVDDLLEPETPSP